MEEEYEKDTFCEEEIFGEGRGRIDAAMERELHGRQSVYALIALIVGAILLGVYLVLGVILDGTVANDLTFLLFLCGVIPFAVGLVYTITYARLRRVAACAAENRYCFGAARFYVISRSASGELIGKARYRYDAVTKVAKSERYLFLTVRTETQSGIFPVLRESMNAETERFLAERISLAHPKGQKKK